MCVRGIDVDSVSTDLAIRLWNCSDGEVFFTFFFILFHRNNILNVLVQST